MDVAIIGTCNMGSGLAKALTAAGHSVTVTSKDPAKAHALADEIGGRAAGSSTDATADAKVVILAVYRDAFDEVLAEAGDAFDGKIVIDISNRANENPGLAVDGSSNAELLQDRLPNSRVVKAFNTVFASRLGDPRIDGIPLDGFVAGDASARPIFLELVGSIGLRPVDAGSLEAARILEAMEALNIAIQMRDQGTWNNGWKLLEATS